MPEYDEQLRLMNEILAVQFSEDFVRKMKARVFVAFHRYGPSKRNSETNWFDVVKTVKARLDLYEQTGNKEHLVDAANFIMVEFMYPQHSNAHFECGAEEEGDRSGRIVHAAETLLRYETEMKKGITE